VVAAGGAYLGTVLPGNRDGTASNPDAASMAIATGALRDRKQPFQTVAPSTRYARPVRRRRSWR
jgi:hypothetical protein